jgi:hypothetical protein
MLRKILLCLSLLMLYVTVQASGDSLARWEGIWYVNMSNFKLWLKGDKTNPRFDYALQTKSGETGLRDVVRYTKSGKEKTIRGFDRAVNAGATKFVWQGNGLLFLFKSKWEILFESEDWVLVHFQKTLATAEGYDVISRRPDMDEETIGAIRAKLQEWGIVAELTLLHRS